MSQKKKTTNQTWPELPAPSEWQEALDTVHLWTQIIGKIRLEQMPWINHCWHVTLYVSSRGLTTSLIPHPSGGFEIEFNFIDHLLEIRTTNGESASFDLASISVADFYHKIMDSLRRLGISTSIYPKPVEIPDPVVPFPKDTDHATYDADAIYRFWIALRPGSPGFHPFSIGLCRQSESCSFLLGCF